VDQHQARVRGQGWRRVVLAVLATSMVTGSQLVMPLQHAAAATTNTISLHVQSARDQQQYDLDGQPTTMVHAGDAVTEYSFIINEDNTGSTEQRNPSQGCSPEDADYPASCHWASIAGLASSAPILTQGTQDDLSDSATLDLPDGRYLISVLADGYRLDGLHFTLPAEGGDLTVELQPTPLPTATIKAQVFADISQANGQYDPGENGLANFEGHISDVLGEVSTDVFGNPLCSTYVPGSGPNGYEWVDGAPVVDVPGGRCYSDADGVLTIPNLGPNRYTLQVIPPDGTEWVQTTTLEGNHDWDAWVAEGATGLDTEFTVAGEPFPAIIFGFVPGPSNDYPLPTMSAGTGTITGVVDAVKVYVPAKGGLTNGGTIWGGLNGGKIDKPIENPWIVLNDLQQNDTAVWVGQGNANGKFMIPDVPPGNYSLTFWDEPQDYILDIINVTVGGTPANGEVVDLGILPLTGWWTMIDGYVFNDANRNGVKDPGEQGISNYTLTLRRRENSLMDRGTTTVTTNNAGYYQFEAGYPLTEWIVLEAYNDLFYTTGITYQADNQAEPTTVLGAGVDLNVLPIIGLSGRVDWGVHAYDPTGNNGIDPRNGGIVGTVSYDTTRNELDPRYAAVEDWQPGVSGLTVDLYQPVDCGTNAGVQCDPAERYELAPDGSYATGKLLNTYVTESWQRPTGCVARDVNGDPLAYPTDQQVLPDDPNADCLEGPLMGVQFGTFNGGSEFGATVDGNYGFGDGCYEGTLDATDPSNPVCDGGAFEPLEGASDYLVHVEIPNDGFGKPLYKFTREEDINIGNGDSFVPQVPPPACAGALHTVDVANIGTDGPDATVNPTFLEIGGSPYEGTEKPLCDTKLVPLNNGRSIVPTFNVFTDVPLPGRFFGLLVDDLNFSTDPKSLLFGEKAGIPFAPVGIYDFANRLVTTVETDYNGLYDVLLPSTNRINCPTPSGVCAGLYHFVGNDPGIPGRLNLNYSPQYRTITADFESWPGLIVPADNAPTQIGVSVQLPGSQTIQQLSCPVNEVGKAATTPEVFAVSKPYADTRDGAQAFSIAGQGFGSSIGEVTLDGVSLPTTSWSDTAIDVDVPSDTAPGAHQLTVSNADGDSTVNGLTFHVLGVGPFPSTPVLDNFNRSGFGSNWNADNVYSLNSNNVRVTGTGTMRWNGNTGGGPSYGASQEAFFTFVEMSPTATEQGLFLKVTGNGSSPNPTNNSSAYVEVSYKATTPTSVQVRTKRSGTSAVVLQATFPATFAANDTLGARALSNGTVIAYKNGVEIGRVNVVTNPNVPAGDRWLAANAAGGGRLGIRFVGAQNNTTNDARFDNFGGGTVTGYTPNVYEVGPGRTYDPGPWVEANPSHAIQDAIDDAAASNGDDIVIVYPNDPEGARINPLGAYYENLIITAPVKLQGVGPGSPDGSVRGTILDAGAFGGDTVIADAWRTRLGDLVNVDADGNTTPAWLGNPDIGEAAGITMLALSQNQYGTTSGSSFPAAVDGFQLRGGDQQGFPNNINQIGGGPTGLPPAAQTQGGAIYTNAYVRNLQITNNVVQNNSGTFGTIRIGSPDLPDPDNHNENVRIANNRIVANAGTNLAGGIGLFAGADNYQVTGNDLCANFSSEYGGGLTVYGRSNDGEIDHNRIYFNRSFDEGGGVMIAGQLPFDPAQLSPGSGPVNIHDNLIQGNLANDDGGGIRFLMAGNFPMNVVNNMIVDNVSTHEGGGIGINDAPNVRVVNNTIMKNVTTATAVTSNGFPAPAGLSTSANSDLLQATLPGGSPTFSDPLLFNNIFWDNKAGTRAGGTVVGIGSAGDATPVNNWDLGVADGTGVLTPTNSIVQSGDGVGAATNSGDAPQVVAAYDVTLSFAPWRTNPNFVGAILVAQDLPPKLIGDYHIVDASPAVDLGAASKAGVAAPLVDIDGDPRPNGAAVDAGADELPGGTVVKAFPKTPVLDDFNRPDGALGVDWGGGSAYAIVADQVRVNSSGDAWWQPTVFGAEQEAYLTFTQVSVGASRQGVFLKQTGNSPTANNAALIDVTYDPGAGAVVIRTVTKRQGTVVRATLTGVTFVTGDQLGARAGSDGTVSVYKNGVLVGSTNVTSGAGGWPTAKAQGGGLIGLRSNGATTADPWTLDDFGGGTMP
jgi:hypothetical protein